VTPGFFRFAEGKQRTQAKSEQRIPAEGKQRAHMGW
jgi:hypothetical protein